MRALAIAALLSAVATTAYAAPRRPVTRLAVKSARAVVAEENAMQEAKMPKVLEARPTIPVLHLSSLPENSSFIAFHTARVQRDLMLFHPDFPDLIPAIGRNPKDDPTLQKFTFVQPPPTDDELVIIRERDRLLLFRDGQSRSSNAALGVAMFGAMTVISAHVPGPVRVLFDHPVHLGPAVFDDGAMGIGVGAKFL